MGFCDMKKFNQALLARQAWRLTQHPNSLCAKLVKACYYQNGDIVDTVFPSEAGRGARFGATEERYYMEDRVREQS
jgi:hypothetical protein